MKVFKLLSALNSITLLCVIGCTMFLYISNHGSTRVKLTHNRAAVIRRKQTTYDWTINISEDTRLDQLFTGLIVDLVLFNATMRANDIDIRGKVYSYIHLVWPGIAAYSLASQKLSIIGKRPIAVIVKMLANELA